MSVWGNRAADGGKKLIHVEWLPNHEKRLAKG